MPITLHSASAPVLERLFTNMLAWLDKAEKHAQARKFDTANYLGLRLAPDMLPLVRQVQIASDGAKGCMARLAGMELPKWEDNEASFDDLRARIGKTLDFVRSVPASAFEGADAREVVLPQRQGEPLRMDGESFFKHFALPNVYFHAMATYALLRHAGVDLGKRDYLGP